jgi:uroporphyrinogen decarboxylase
MNTRQRFLNTLCEDIPIRPPLFAEGLRDDVLQAWRSQGLPPGARLEDLFNYDPFVELAPDIYPTPEIDDWSHPARALRLIRQRLDPDDERRLPAEWLELRQAGRERSYPLFVRIHQGLFLSLAINGWRTFKEAIQLLVDEPAFVEDVMALQTSFAARLVENLLEQVPLDAVIFSEPIAGNHGPLISPAMYRRFALASYQPLVNSLAERVPVLIWRSYANPGPLTGEAVQAGFNTLWLCEAPPAALHPARVRQLLGQEVGLIGGIDTDVLYQEPQAIHKAIESIVQLVRQGRFIPLADGRVREDVPYANYRYYRHALEKMIGQIN